MTRIRRHTLYVIVDLAIAALLLLETVSGVILMFVLTGGFQGGRNPNYGRVVLLGRHGWELLHNWGGLAMAALALLHVVLHWRWIVGVARSYGRRFYRGEPGLAA